MDTVINLIWLGLIISVALFLFRVVLWILGLILAGILTLIAWILEKINENKE